MVETAVAFPLLVLAAIGLLQFAIVVHDHNVVEAAVQEGARVAAADTGGNLDAGLDAGTQHARDLLRAGLGRHVHDVTVDPGGSTQDVIRLHASGHIVTILPWFDPRRGGLTHLDVPLDVTATVTHEHFRPSPATTGGA
jgi:hypothetical protein